MRCHGITTSRERCRNNVESGKYCHCHKRKGKKSKGLKFNFLNSEMRINVLNIFSPKFFKRIYNKYHAHSDDDYRFRIEMSVNSQINNLHDISNILIKDRRYYLDKYKHATDYPVIMMQILKDIRKRYLSILFGLIKLGDLDLDNDILLSNRSGPPFSSFSEYYDNFTKIFTTVVNALNIHEILDEAQKQIDQDNDVDLGIYLDDGEN